MSKRKKPGLFCLNQQAWGRNPPLPTPGHTGAPVSQLWAWEAEEDAGQSLTPPPDPAPAPAPSPRSRPTGSAAGAGAAGPGARVQVQATGHTLSERFMAQAGQRNS